MPQPQFAEQAVRFRQTQLLADLEADRQRLLQDSLRRLQRVLLQIEIAQVVQGHGLRRPIMVGTVDLDGSAQQLLRGRQLVQRRQGHAEVGLAITLVSSVAHLLGQAQPFAQLEFGGLEIAVPVRAHTQVAQHPRFGPPMAQGVE